MKTATQIALIFTIGCILAFARTVRADELQVRQPTQAEIGKIVSCPVTNERVEVSKDTPVVDYRGKSYYFCCPGCVEDFKNNPDKYASPGDLPPR